jgi:predicted ATP-grasp superfamily ATP-dependent carboligase
MEEWRGAAPLLIQQFITGCGEGVFGIATEHGIEAWTAHRRIRMMNPHGSGSSACASTDVSPDLRSQVEALMRRSGWKGIFMIELLRDERGKQWFVEMNGRPWGSMALSRRQGFEYPAWQVQSALGEGTYSQKLPYRSGVLCRHLGRELMHLLFLLRGPKSKAIADWPAFWPTIRSLLSFRSGDGFYNWNVSDPAVFFADTTYTLLNNLKWNH